MNPNLNNPVAYGVHGYGFTSGNTGVRNGAVLMHDSHFDTIYEWADLQNAAPNCEARGPRECVCKNVRFALFRLFCVLLYGC